MSPKVRVALVHQGIWDMEKLPMPDGIPDIVLPDGSVSGMRRV